MSIQVGNKKIKDVYFGNKKIKAIYNGATLVYSSVAPRYIEVDYLTLASNQYFDTGIKQNNTTQIIAEFAPLNQNVCNIATSMGLILIQSGAHLEMRVKKTDSANYNITNMISTVDYSGNTYYKTYYNIDNEFWAEYNDVVSTKYTIPKDIVLDTNDSLYTIFINTGPNNTYRAAGKYRRIEIYNHGELAFKGIPCKDIIDNKYGYYDMVTNSFITEYADKAITGGDVLDDGYKFMA